MRHCDIVLAIIVQYIANTIQAKELWINCEASLWSVVNVSSNLHDPYYTKPPHYDKCIVLTELIQPLHAYLEYIVCMSHMCKLPCQCNMLLLCIMLLVVYGTFHR